jgi:hypothetical protein
MNMQRNPVGWFEIPVNDMDRAVRFYETVFGFKLELHKMGPVDMAWFPMLQDKEGAAGTLAKGEGYKPSYEGTLVYFTAHSGDLSNELSKVESAGGKVLATKFPIGEHGFVGLAEDTEGNRIAIHSLK